MRYINWTPTPKKHWPKIGDRVVSPAGVQGDVIGMTDRNSPVPRAHVVWSNGHKGAVAVTNIRRVETK